MIKWNSFVPLLIKNTLLLIVAASALIGLVGYATDITLIDHLKWELLPASVKTLVLCVIAAVPALATLWEIDYDDDPDKPRTSWLDD